MKYTFTNLMNRDVGDGWAITTCPPSFRYLASYVTEGVLSEAYEKLKQL